MKPPITILAINTGSSSIKFSLYESALTDEPVYSGSLTRIGLGKGLFTVTDPDGDVIACSKASVPDHPAACSHVFSWILSSGAGMPDAIGHRIVHGGPRHAVPEHISPELLASVAELVPYAPEHLPQALDAVKQAMDAFPGVFQVACFDTAFHRTMPPIAQMYPLPASFRNEGIIRYGFHGLSYEHILGELSRQGDPAASKGRVVLAHLGHGASMAAVRDGRSVDTTMGFSPAGGLVMSTRTGDLDPGVVLFLLKHDRLGPDRLRDLFNKEGGLIGLSGASDDMQELLEAEGRDSRARDAVGLFCYQARKHLGALVAVLGGLDLLVFTGGIGEYAPEIRSRICSGMEYLGIRLDREANLGNKALISSPAGPVRVRVMKANEELTIVRQTRRVLESQ